MKKLEKSVRHELNRFYGPKLRAGGWYLPLGATGDPPKSGFFRAAYADVEDGIVTDITIYTYSDATMRRHAEEWDGVIDITEAVQDYLNDCDYIGWDGLVAAICEAVEEGNRHD